MTINFSEYYQPKPKQIEAHANRTKYILYGGSMGSGKSWWLCAEAILNSLEFAGNRGVIIRKERSVIINTILITFFQICPPQVIKSFNRAQLKVTFINDSVLLFMSADKRKDPLLNKLKGLEISFACCDESNEIDLQAYQILKTRLRWILPNGKKPRYEIRLTSNPENCWLINEFIQSTHPDTKYIAAKTTDNYDENSEYVQTLKEAFKDNPTLLNRYLNGDWSLVDSINQLIQSNIIENCKERVNSWGSSIGCDVARYGNDKTVILILINGNIELIETYEKTSIDEVANRVMYLSKQYNIHNIGIDVIGIGSGVADIMKAKHYPVIEIVGGAKPEIDRFSNEPLFKSYNLRSQMYYELSESMKNNEIGNLTDEALKQELSSIQYEIVSEKTVRILSKKIIKKLTGRSPDIADALAYANHARKGINQRVALPFLTGE